MKSLWKDGYRYVKHPKAVFGNPDLVFKKYKLAVFVDGKFWHGWNFKNLNKTAPKTFWVKKIESNVKRDELVNETLKSSGWTVVRFWDDEVEKSVDSVINIIRKKLNET